MPVTRRINREAEKLPSLPLPARRPTAGAIASWGTGPEKYDVEFWNFEYQVRRSLERASDDYLRWRYRGILRNIARLVCVERDVIPIQSFLSSWYWFRKEYETRLEFALREHPITLPNLSLYQTKSAPYKPKHPNYGNVLFRYGRNEHLQRMLAGSIRLGNSSFYARLENDEARRDLEHLKTSFLPGASTRVTTSDGRELAIHGDVTRSVEGPHYFLLSMSAEWDPKTFDDFQAQACLVIRDTEAFRSRMRAGCLASRPGWISELIGVEYFDPYDMIPNHIFNSTMSKDFFFAYQQEWRFVCCRPDGHDAVGEDLRFEIQPLVDIAEILPAPSKD